MSYPINKRLLTCASLVRQGARLADIGTDHAYLPIYLLKEGRIKSAVLSDINRGPLLKAEENAREAGLTDKTELILANGASDLAGKGVTDYTICGMGGELIAEIIGNADHLKDSGINLILQPMSKPECLRAYLFENGFSIEKELFVTDEGKHYVCILAHYTGEASGFTSADAYFGFERNESAKTPAGEAYYRAKLASLFRIIDGKRKGGEDTSFEEELKIALESRLGIRSDT